MNPLTAYFERLLRSFAAVSACLKRPRIARRVVVALLAVHTVLLGYSAYVHSPTLNEPGHLVAGLSIWKFGRFDVYSVNPPLVKLVAALPVIAAGYEEDWSAFHTGPGARPEFSMGEDFVAVNGERSFFLFMIARWACIPFSWLGAIVCYLWARDLFGRPSGVVACVIWCFEPNILAHASLITPDAHATALGIAACYTFWRWLKHPTWTQAALTGVVLGLAELAKTTLILFYPLWPLMWVVYRLMERRSVAVSLREMNPRAERETYTWLREGGMLALRMAIGLYVINLGYGFEGSFKPLGEFHFVSDLFAGKASGVGGLESEVTEIQHPASSIQHRDIPNRFADTWLASLPIPFPANYLVGIDLQQRDFEEYGHKSYLRGEWRDRGWWYFYLYAAAIKVPLGLWLLGVYTLCLAIFAPPTACRQKTKSSLPDVLILLFPAIVIFSVASSMSGFSEHFRYALPCLPFAFIAIAQIAENIVDNVNRRNVLCVTRQGLPSLVRCALVAVVLWSGMSSLWLYPHSLAFFNELIGGPMEGPSHLLGSNVDWGQDLRYLASWHSTISQDRPTSIILAYCGSYDPADVGIEYIRPSELLTPDSHNDEHINPIRVSSVNFLKGFRGFLFGSTRSFNSNGQLRVPSDESECLSRLTYALSICRPAKPQRQDDHEGHL